MKTRIMKLLTKKEEGTCFKSLQAQLKADAVDLSLLLEKLEAQNIVIQFWGKYALTETTIREIRERRERFILLLLSGVAAALMNILIRLIFR